MELHKKQYILAGGILVLLIVFFAGFKYGDISNSSNKDELDLNELVIEQEQPSEKIEEDIYIEVYVTGEVQNKGVYKLKEHSRIYEAVELAVPLESANVDHINMAGFLSDGETIIVPSKNSDEEIIDAFSPGFNIGTSKININRATANELESLTGIGPALANRIIDHRTSSGNFSSIEEIKNVSGIGDAIFNNIKNDITVR
ncbi:Late competence protein ComEA, DNA receptor [Candidatus Syntrophocurvum alkaliphilum]|uniref:Late competence protein ComEA, DNA receptor n=1 Tax=Candidatus Syntrophocurvum alkaliphilum TaxID=2293317 RepID=A0A6I6DID0_9FIRM|nr:helix-hairpin-helix domain-containing protein [Candidatus Syntrophocurvum alkaliphilum]QGU00021.1 Late competence protein ComEA, DNA receptor [Candidatus Syntrophocurvum alkaliphilum]